MAKKIAVIYSGGRYWGGIETFNLNLFKNYEKDKLELIFYSLGDWPLTKEIKTTNEKVLIFPKTRFQPLTIFKIAKEAKKQGVTLFVSGGFVADSYARAASLVSGIADLSVVHSDFDLDYPFILRLIYRILLFISEWKTKRYLAVSEYLKTKLLKRGVRFKKIKVIYNGVAFKAEKTLQKQGKTFGSVGRLHPVKNYEELLIAGKHLYEKYGYKLIIWGEGPQRRKLEKIIGGKDFASMPGQLKFEEVVQGIDIYIQPSLSEGFGLAVVEAMIAGLPVVVTPGGSLKEIVKDGETGIVTTGFEARDIYSAIEKLILNPELKEKVAKTGQEYAKKEFSLGKWIEEIQKILLETN